MDALGALLVRLGWSWAPVGGLLDALGALLDALGALLGASWGPLGGSWTALGPPWVDLGRPKALQEAFLGPLGSLLGVSWSLQRCPIGLPKLSEAFPNILIGSQRTFLPSSSDLSVIFPCSSAALMPESDSFS